MSKISTYEVAPVPKLSDKLIGTSVGGEIEDITYNFTLLELLELFLPIIPANNLQGVLDYGNTATQDINLFGTITTTNLDVTDTANLFITYLNEETHLVGSLFDSADSVGTAGQVLTSTGDGVEWFTLPPIFTPNLEQVLTEGNTSSIDILLNANLEALDVSADTATVGVNLTLGGTVTDNSSAVGSAGQVLSSTVTGVVWVSLPVYSATSPLLFNSATGVFSIQVANSTQDGYLTANDWVTFDGKQNAGAYITALTGEATATGPGSVPITLNNASVTAKVLTGLNVTGGSISASDSILTAFGKVQSQINGLMGGVQYQGVWDAATNTPTLTSSVGTQGHYYIVNVAGNTDLNGITDWKVGDWAIFSGGTWQKVDNTESVTSVNGQTGAVSLTTDNIPEGATNLYYLDSRARGALSFAAGSGAYNSLTGVITIPTDNNQILNGAGYITLSSISATSPLAYNNLTGVFSIQQADATHNGYLSSTDWSTFNNKQNYLGGTGLVKSTAGTITYITDNSGNWNTAYNRSIISAAVTGTTTKTLTLNEQDGNTITASWTDLDTGLTSVGVSMPSAFSVANSPLTANGTIAVTGAGTTLQYIDGTGALRTFPGLTGYVPYTGATQNVDLGEFGISAGYFQADLTPTGALQVGRMQWNSTDGTMDLRLLGNNVTLQIGQENVTRVVNKSGIDLLEANYQVVRIRKVAEGGAQGQRLAVVLAQGNNENNSTEVIGLVTETINVNQEGFVTSFGEVKSINTTGSLQGETWVDGDILYLSSTVAGQLTNIRPVAPNHSVIVGYVVYAHANNGKIYMAIDTGYELGELHNVYAPSPTANQSIYWNVANSRYQLNTIGGILGYTPANAATTISTTAPLQGGGDLSANRTFSITQSGASTDGYLSSTDWNTFNNKQPAGSYVPTSRLLSINGTQYDLSADRSWSVGTVTSVAALTLGTTGTDLSSSVATGTTTPVITLNVPTASAANRGALSAADWSTFNTKVGGVTATSPLASSGGQTPNITIQQSSGSQDGYLSSTDWTTFNNKQASGNYITSLTGEATGTGPGATAVTLNNASVTGKVLTGVNITGGTVQATDTMLTAFGKLQNQINGLIGSTIYQGTWNASTNTPALASGVGTRGYYYIVSVAGTTNLDGITDWFVGDWAIFDGTAWQQVDNTDAVVSVNGQTGAVSLTTDNIPEGATNQYFLNSRARAALSFTAGSGAYNNTTGVITIPTNNNQITNGANYITLASLSGTAPIVYSNTTGAISITQAGTASNGYLSSTDWNTFNNKAPSVSGGYLALSGGVMTGQIVLKESSGSADYTKGLRFPDDPFGGGGDASGLRLYATSGESMVLELYVQNDSGSDKINFATGIAGGLSNDDVTINGNKIWNAGNLPTPQTAITLTTTGTSGAATFNGVTLNIPQYQSVLTNPVTGTGTANEITYWTGTSTVGSLSTATYPSLTELSYVKGVTSAIQTQLDGKLSLSGGTMTGPIGLVNGAIGIIVGDDATIADRNVANTMYVAGVQNTDRGYINFSETAGNQLGAINGGALTWRGAAIMTTANVSGTVGYIPKFTAANSVGNSIVQDEGTNITVAGGVTAAGIISTSGTGLLASVRIANTTATTGKDWHLYSLNNGNFGLYNNTDANYAYLITPSGNLGLGVTPSASTTPTIEVGFVGNALVGRSGIVNLTLNAYRTATWKYANSTGGVSNFELYNGGFDWYNAASGTAGTDISFALKMRLNNSGQLGIGVDPTQMLDVNGNGKFRGQDLLLGSSVDADNVIYIYSKNSAQSQIRTNAGVSSSYNGMMISSNYNAANSLPSWSIDLGGALNSTTNVNAYTLGYRPYGGAWASLMTVSASGDTVISNSVTAASAIFNNGTNSTNGIKVISTTSASAFTGGIEFIRTTVTGGSKIQPLRDTAIGGVGFDFLVTVDNSREISGVYTSALKILNNGKVGIGISPSSLLDIFKTGYTGNQFKTYAELSTAPSVLSYSTSDGMGLIINMYEAIAGPPYTRYADFVASTSDVSSSVMRFFTKNYSSNPAVALTLASTGAATFSNSITAGTDVTLNNGVLYVSAGSGTAYSSRLSTVYNYPYIETYLDSFAGTSYEGRLLFRTNSGGGVMSTKLTITNSGAAIFNGTITANGALFTAPVSINGSSIPSDRWFEVTGTTSGKVFGAVFNPTFTYTGANIYGIYVGNNFNTGTITSSYNLYIEGTSVGSATITNRFGLYQAGGSDRNYFAGNVGVNTTNPLAGVQIEKYGSKFDSDVQYNQPAGNVFLSVTGAVANQDNWFGMRGSYNSSTGSANLLLQANYRDIGSQAGHYISSVATSLGAAYFEIGKLTTSGSISTPPTKVAQFAISSAGGVTITNSASPGLNIVKDASSDNRYLRLTNTQASSVNWDLINQQNAGGNGFIIYNATANTTAVEITPTGNMTARGVIGWYSGIGALSYGSGFVTMETNTANAIQFKTNGTTALTLNTNQSAKFANLLGIGKDPSYNLDVNGSIRGSDRLYWNGFNQLVYILNYDQLSMVDNTIVTDSTASQGYASKRSVSSPNGTFFYGNYTSMTPGNYVAYFRMKVTSNASATQICQLDVVGGSMIGFAIGLKPNMFEANDTWQYFRLPFTVTGGSYIEWRGIGFATGITDLFFDHVMIYQEGGVGQLFARSSYSIYVNQNTLGMQLNTSGAMTVTSSVTATAFFESSDSRLKNLIKDDYKAIGIETIKPKLYIKDGKEEVGYFAQDFESILSTAVSKNDAGFLSLSYTQVHTAKIAIIEDEVDVLKKEVSELKVKLQKYEA